MTSNFISETEAKLAYAAFRVSRLNAGGEDVEWELLTPGTRSALYAMMRVGYRMGFNNCAQQTRSYINKMIDNLSSNL